MCFLSVKLRCKLCFLSGNAHDNLYQINPRVDETNNRQNLEAKNCLGCMPVSSTTEPLVPLIMNLMPVTLQVTLLSVQV